VENKYLRGVNLIALQDGGELRYYLFNLHGDVVRLTDKSGTVVKEYDYDAFGNHQGNGKDKEDINPFRYCGEYWDVETGTVYLRARYYNPRIGRLLSEDTHWNPNNLLFGDRPLKINKFKSKDVFGLNAYAYLPDIQSIIQSRNLYVYCSNNPIIFIDPTGQLMYPGQVHNMVSKRIVAENPSLSRERWLKYNPPYEPLETLRGRVDLVDTVSGYIWEIKPYSDSHIVAGKLQLANYANTGIFVAKELKGLDIQIYSGDAAIDGYKLSGCFVEDVYTVSYGYYGDGIIVYQYEVNWSKVVEQVGEAAAKIVIGLILAAAASSGLPLPAIV